MMRLSLLLTALLLPIPIARAQQSDRGARSEPKVVQAPDPLFDAGMFDGLAWRNTGPANPVGRCTDIAIHPDRQSTWFVGTAGGGLWRTRNAGTTWENVFDSYATVSIGDVAIAPSDPDVVWIGTGEENARNSVQWGDGVYRSTDGGETWHHMGLRESFQIGHIAIHPTNSEIVYVAALGRLWGSNEERGVYRTRNGGADWERVLFLDEDTGCVEVRLNPADPSQVFACMYERRRDRWDSNDPVTRFGSTSGIYRSTDGGDSWRRLTGGLPGASKWGRCGIDFYPPEPDTLFAIIETERSGWATGSRQRLTDDEKEAAKARGAEEARRRPTPRGSAIMGIGGSGGDGGEDAPGAVLGQVSPDGPARTAGLAPGDRITAIDGEDVRNYRDLIDIIQDSRAGQKVQVTFVRGDDTKTVELTFGRRQRRFSGIARNPDFPNGGRLFGQIANVQDKQGEDGFETGGVFVSTDRGENWRRINSLTERPFYYSVIRVDPRDRQNLYCVGTTLWGSRDGGNHFEGINHGIHVDFHAIWVDPDDGDHLIACCDGGVNETFDHGKSWQVFAGFCAAQYYDVWADNSVPYNVIGGLQDNGTWVGPSRTRYREGITTLDWFKIRGGDGFGAVADPVEPWIVLSTSQNGSMGISNTQSGRGLRLRRDRPTEGTARWNWDSPFVLSPHNRLTFYHAGSHVFRGERHRGSAGAGGRNGGLTMKCISGPLGLSERGTAVSLAESPREIGLLYVGTDDGALWRTDDGGVHWIPLHENLPTLEPLYVSDLWPSRFASDRVYLTLDGHRSDDFSTYVFVSEDRGETWRSLAFDLPLREPCYAFAEDPRNQDLLFLGTEYGCYASLDRGERWFPMGSGLPTVSVRDLFIQDRDSDLIAGTHGRGVWIADIEPLRQLDAGVARSAGHLFAPEDAILWRTKSRTLQGHRDYRASNPPPGAVFYVYLRDEPDDPPSLTIHDVLGERLATIEGQRRAGLQAIHWNARDERKRPVPPGSYAVRWKGHEDAVRAFRLLPDPELAASPAGISLPTQAR